MQKHLTPLRALLGTAVLTAAPPDLFGPSTGTDRRLKSPADTGFGGGPLHPTAMANPTRGLTLAADGLGAGASVMAKTSTDVIGHLADRAPANRRMTPWSAISPAPSASRDRDDERT